MTRSRARGALVWVLLFQGVSAVGGGAALVAGAGGDDWFPADWLDGLPFDSWLWPGMILGVGLGLSAFVLAYGVRHLPRWRLLDPVARLTGHHWSWVGSLALGVGLMAWIVVQLAVIPGRFWLQPLYFGVGALIVALTVSGGVRRDLRRQRDRRTPH